MRDASRMHAGRQRGFLVIIFILAVAFSTYVEQVASLPADTVNEWPTFPRRNIAALARNGYLKNSGSSYKRSISILAKNGMLPTYRSPYVETDKPEQEDEQSQDKRNMASIARLRSYSTMKRNIQALARDGYRVGRGLYNLQDEKRNIAALARNGLLHKKDGTNSEEYYYPFYQNSLPPMSDIEGPFDTNDINDIEQSLNPDFFPTMSQLYKRSAIESAQGYYNQKGDESNWYFKRGSVGLPVHGLYRPMYIDPTVRTKRYIEYTFPDEINTNDVNDKTDSENEDKRSVDEDVRDNFEKRHIGSLARLGLLPSFRFSGGRYSRSGRARLLLPNQEMYRKHSTDENFGIRKYFVGAQVDAIDSDDADVPPQAVPPHSHPTGRYLHRPLSNDFPKLTPSIPLPPLLPPNDISAFNKNRWQTNTKESPRFYYFRSLKVPYHTSGKRYLLLPAVDNILLRKGYRNSSLPSRRKNQ